MYVCMYVWERQKQDEDEDVRLEEAHTFYTYAHTQHINIYIYIYIYIYMRESVLAHVSIRYSYIFRSYFSGEKAQKEGERKREGRSF